MKNNLCFLITAKRGCYTVVSPTFEASAFQQTNELIRANTVTPFGFPFDCSVTIPLGDIASPEQNKETKTMVFKKLVESLIKKKEESGADYILINAVSFTDLPSYPLTAYIDQCQFFVSIKQNLMQIPLI